MLIQKLKEIIKWRLIYNHAILAPLIPNKYFPYRFAGGRIYLNIKESRFILARAIGMYEAEKIKAINRLLKPGATFIDVGVNMGDFSLLAAKIVGGNGKVLSFEPEPNNCHWIRKSSKLNGYKNITLFEVALSDADGDAQLYLGTRSCVPTLLPGRHNKEVINVKKRSLDSVLKEINQNKVDMMKIDVEGAELQVLRGACKTLSENKDIILLMDIHPQFGVNPKEVCDFLEELGFSIYQMRFPFDMSVKVGKDLFPYSLSETIAYRKRI